MQSNRKIASCKICHKQFPKPSLLRRHEIVHSALKIFQCHECNRKFSYKSSLERHKRIHQTERPHKCPKCELRFLQKSNLLTHMKRVHPKDERNKFKCNICACVFLKLNSLKRHIAIRHSSSNPDQNRNLSSINNLIDELKSLQKDLGSNSCERENIEQGQMQLKEQTTVLSCSGEREADANHNEKSRVASRARPKRSFLCWKCGKLFSWKVNLEAHIETHQKNDYISCALCNKDFKFKKQLDLHAESSCNFENYNCSKCGKCFATSKHLYAHKRVHKSKDPAIESLAKSMLPPVKVLEQSENAPIEFDSSSYQCKKLSHIKHDITHLQQREFKCLTCFRIYSTENALTAHQKIHVPYMFSDLFHGKRIDCASEFHSNHCSYRCPVCAIKFKTKSSLKRHAIVHSDERNFKCPYCELRFKTNNTCKNHILTHLKNLLDCGSNSKAGSNQKKNSTYGDFTCATIPPEMDVPKPPPKEHVQTLSGNPKAPHPCAECGKTFRKPSDLQRHCRVHSKEKPFKCDTCQKCFSLKSTLKDHSITHLSKSSSSEERFNCQVCGKKYTTKKSLAVHLRLHTCNRPFPCQFCPRSFRTSGHRISHLKTTHKNASV